MILSKQTKASLDVNLGSDLKFPIQETFTNIAGLDLLLQDIQLLLLTVPGERVHRPNYGCNIRNLLWENLDDAYLKARAEIKASLDKWEPRITCTGVVGSINRNTGLIMFRVGFVVNATNTNVNLVFPLRNSLQISNG